MTINKKYYTDNGQYQGTYIFLFKIRKFYINWFTDCGEWFFILRYHTKYIRFSSCGFDNNMFN